MGIIRAVQKAIYIKNLNVHNYVIGILSKNLIIFDKKPVFAFLAPLLKLNFVFRFVLLTLLSNQRFFH